LHVARTLTGVQAREKRYNALGKTGAGRRLFVIFTVGRKLIRVVSATDMKKKPPECKNEDDEREFWATADSTEYVDWQAGKRKKLVQLKPSLRTISLRLPVSMIEDLKVLAHRRDVPYQSLLKVFLAERLARERQPRPD
jgi:predicted DNA binding CopG/RHH family protein